MKVYDDRGRQAVSNEELDPITGHYVRADLSDTISGELYTFTNPGASIRFKNGRLQHYNVTNGLWYYEICFSEGGVPVLALSDEVGESSSSGPSTNTFRIKNGRAQWKVNGLWYYWEGKVEDGILLGSFTDEPGETV
jgi:hypothetical protein